MTKGDFFMMRRAKQARFTQELLVLAIALSLGMALPGHKAEAALKKLPSYGPPTHEEHVSSDEIGDFFDNLFGWGQSDQPGTPRDKKANAADKKEPKKESDTKTTPAKDDTPTWSAKRGHDPEAAGTANASQTAPSDGDKAGAKPAAPAYRVYHAPMVQQVIPSASEAPPPSVTPLVYDTPAPPLTVDTPPVAQTAKMPPPPLEAPVSPRPALGAASRMAPQEPAVPRVATFTNPTQVATPRVNAPAPRLVAKPAPAQSLPVQFFPILPRGAEEMDVADMPPEMLPVASNHGLEEIQPDVTRAVVYIHDMTRDVGKGLSLLTALAGPDEETTMILVPQFPLEVDVVRFASVLADAGQSVARWGLDNGDHGDLGWQSGGESLSLKPRGRGISSFTALDLLLLYLGDKNRFPSLQQVVVAGFGYGADFVDRYATFGMAPDVLARGAVQMRFVAANANTYLYTTPTRPKNGGLSEADKKACPNVDDYPYGLERLGGYARATGANAARLNFIDKHVAYLLSDGIAIDPLLDRNCAALLQGDTRLSRAVNFRNYLATTFGDSARNRTFTMIPNAGNDPGSLLKSYCGVALLFGNGMCEATR